MTQDAQQNSKIAQDTQTQETLGCTTTDEVWQMMCRQTREFGLKNK